MICPRCKNGHLFLEKDDVVCINCGYRNQVVGKVVVKEVHNKGAYNR